MGKITRSEGLVADQKNITTDLDDTVANQNAVQHGRNANAILVGQDGSSTGAVKIRFADGTDDTIPYLTPGIWHNMAPFTHVWSTGTTADSVRIGRTF
jgi:hypothetical protein